MAQKIHLKKEPILGKKHEAFSYQAEAVSAIKDLDYAAVFHEQGLGKSKIAIDLALYWLEKRTIDTVLLVVKKNLLYNWTKEFKTHSFLKPKVLSQNKKDNYYVFNGPSRLILTHYEVFNSERGRLQLFLKARNVAVILDESTKIKNPQARLTQSFFELAPLFKKRVIMTGTPVANRPYDIWSQIWFLDQGDSLGNNFNEFQKRSNLGNELTGNISAQRIFEDQISEIFSKISRFTVRETKSSGIIELPEKVFEVIKTDWEHYQADLYRQIRDDLRAVVVKEGIPTEDNAGDLLKRLLRLVQVASNPRLVDEGYHAEPGKLLPLHDLITRCCDNKEKSIVWTSFTDNVDWLEKELKNFGAVKVHGKMAMERRNRSIDKFMSTDQNMVLVATPGVAKEGLTLTVANHVIFYDRTFSLDDYLQAQDRIHRISQKSICHVHNLIMNDSIDEWVDVLLQSKHLAAQLSQGDISLDYYKSQMTYEFGNVLRNILGVTG